MHVLIRADASSAIGTGHVMRCLVLADRLLEVGAACLFVCRNFEGHLAGLIEARGHRCVLLKACADPPLDAGYDDTCPAHARWLGSSWQQDAEATIEIAQELQTVDLVVVDNYALDHRWEERLGSHIGRLMVIDDLADRPHCADLLVDQNYGHTKQHYGGLVPDACEVLAGAQFALLRPQFATIRPHALARRQQLRGGKRLLIFLGGGALDQVLNRVAVALCDAKARNLRTLTLVTGGARNGNAIAETLRTRLNVPIEVFESVEDMASLMSQADLAIGGGGVSGWERCALGLPSLVVTLSDNQRAINRRLAQDGLIFASVEPQDLSHDLIARFVDMDDRTYRTISGNAAAVSDGLGTDRVIEVLGLGEI